VRGLACRRILQSAVGLDMDSTRNFRHCGKDCICLVFLELVLHFTHLLVKKRPCIRTGSRSSATTWASCLSRLRAVSNIR